MKRDLLAAPPFAAPAHALAAAQLARVTDVDDPAALARVKVELYSTDTASDVAVWARVASPFAGSQRGGFFIPQVGDEVLVVFIGGDARLPVVVGGLWNGAAKPPESVGRTVDRWSLTGKEGSKISIVEESASTATIRCATPAGVTLTLTDEGGGKVEIVCAGNTITVDSAGVSVQAAAKVSVKAAQVEVSAATVKVDAAMSTFSGVVKCDLLLATTVSSAVYSPGAGNVW